MFGVLVKILLIYLLVVFFRTLYQGYKTMNLLKKNMDNRQDSHSYRQKHPQGGEQSEGVIEAEYRVLDKED